VCNRLHGFGPSHPKLDTGSGWGSLGITVCHGLDLFVIVNRKLVNLLNALIFNQSRLSLDVLDATHMQDIAHAMVLQVWEHALKVNVNKVHKN
jgi:hypothetical protein